MALFEAVKGLVKYRIDDIPYSKSFSLSSQYAIPKGRLFCSSEATETGTSFRVLLKPERKTEIELEHIEVSFSVTHSEPLKSCYLNGFQSWSTSHECSPWSSQRPMNPLLHYWISKYQLRKYGDQHFRDYSGNPGVFLGYTYGYLRYEDSSLLLAASLSEEVGYTEIRLNVEERGERTLLTISRDIAGTLTGNELELLAFMIGTGSELEAFNDWRRYDRQLVERQDMMLGWTSWYNYYNDIDAGVIRENLHAFTERGIPIDLFQIDDGWQPAVGDWLSSNDRFPDGMAPLAKEIREAGYLPGLWLAPFTAEESSEVCQNHADWIVRDEHGPVKAGNNPHYWSGNFYGLDILNPEVQEYVKQVIHRITRKWGFGLIKADFLYSAALVPRRGLSRGAIMHKAMRLLREAAGDALILGCGVPLGQAFDTVDYCRIGSDVAPKWEDWRLKQIRFPERVSTVNSLVSTIGRSQLDSRFFRNDPDVFLLRKGQNSLTQSQKRVLFFTNNLFGGVVLTSDEIGEYSEEELAMYKSSFPPENKRIRGIECDRMACFVDFSIGRRSYWAYINLSGKSRTVQLPGDAGSLWFSEQSGIRPGGWTKKIGGIDCGCFCRVPVRPWSVIGTTGRLFPASEIDQVFREDNELTISFREKTLQVGDVLIRLPRGTNICMVNNNSALIEESYGITFGRASLI